MKKIFILVSVALAMNCLTGCGYTTSSSLPGRLKTVHIEKFVNKIDFAKESGRNLYLPLLEVDVRNAVVERYLFDGNLQVTDSESADLVLKAKLINYERGVLRYTDSDDVEEYRVYITVALKLWDTQNEITMWEEPSFVGEATYFVTGSSASTEETAVNEAITDLARRIVERTIENW